MLLRFDHIQLAIPTGREDQARRFYGDVLGMVEVPKPAALEGRGGCWFTFADCALHLGVDADFTPARKAHPAFACNDLARLRQRLDDAGVPTRDDVRLPGCERFFCDDPFGNRLEFIRRMEAPS